MSRAGPVLAEGGDQITLSSLEQKNPLLRMKLFVPPVRPNCVKHSLPQGARRSPSRGGMCVYLRWSRIAGHAK